MSKSSCNLLRDLEMGAVSLRQLAHLQPIRIACRSTRHLRVVMRIITILPCYLNLLTRALFLLQHFPVAPVSCNLQKLRALSLLSFYILELITFAVLELCSLFDSLTPIICMLR